MRSPFSVKTLFLSFLCISFLAGFFVCLNAGIRRNRGANDFEMENLQDFATSATSATSTDGNSCPDMLIQKGTSLLLYNSKERIVDGINPLPLYNLDEYKIYVDRQRAKGNHCPILFLREENDVQGNDVYRMYSSPMYVEGGNQILPVMNDEQEQVMKHINVSDASRDNPPYNANMYPGFDPTSMDVGRITEIDLIHKSTQDGEISLNPADTNWGGVIQTQRALELGVFSGNNVVKPVFPSYKPK